jgi:hypothetical protein
MPPSIAIRDPKIEFLLHAPCIVKALHNAAGKRNDAAEINGMMYSISMKVHAVINGSKYPV